MSTTMSQSSTTAAGQLMTPFGATVNKSLRSLKGVYRIDLLVALRKEWGNKITNNRDILYSMVAGTCNDAELQSRLRFFYLRYPAFANKVSLEYYFGDQGKSLLQRIIQPARAAILDYQNECVEAAHKCGLTVYGTDEDFLYVSEALSVEGCEVFNA